MTIAASDQPEAVPASLLTDFPQASRQSDSYTLFFAAPAREFTEALPLGNGRLGAIRASGTDRRI